MTGKQPQRKPVTYLAGIATAGALLLSGCAGVSDSAQQPDKKLNVVTGTGVYASIAQEIGKDHIQASALVPVSQDPHSYEPSAKDKLTVSKADIVITNGGGYDAFLSNLATSTGKNDRIVDAVSSSKLPGAAEAAEHAAEETAGGHAGHHHDHGEFNEHVWYSFSAMKNVGEAVAAELSEADPEHKSEYEANAKAFAQKLTDFQAKASAISKDHPGTNAMATEPAPAYLLQTAGVDDVTDEKLTEAVEEEADIPAVVLDQAVKTLTSKSVTFLAFNDQTASPQTQRLRSAAVQSHVPVVSLPETMPEGKTYLQWMGYTVDQIAQAAKSGH